MATSPLGPAGSDGIDIIKDPAFFRTIADTVLVVPKGDETELCFIAVGPDPMVQFNRVADPKSFNPGPVQLKASLSDVGHVRIDGIAAANLALNLLALLISREIITVEELQENIDSIVKANVASPPEGDASEPAL